MNWPLVKLKHITRTVAGGTPNVSEVEFWSDDDETGTAWVSIGDMSGRVTVEETGRRVTEAGIRSARLPIGKPGTLLLSMYASLGHSAVLKVHASWNQAILGIYPRMSCDGRFLKYALVSLKPHLSEFARSNTQDNLNAEQVGNLEIPFPPLDEQRRIADFLDADTARIDRLIAARERQRAVFEERIFAETSETFLPGSLTAPLGQWPWTWLPRIPRDRPLVRLGYVCRLQNGLTVDGKRDISGDVVTRPYLRVANVQAGRVALGTVTEVTVPRAIAEHSTLRPGDVLMTEGGDIDKLGRGTVWGGELDDCLHQNHIFAIRPNSRRLDGEYLAFMTQSMHGRCYFESTGVKTTNLASTNSSKILGFPIPLPSVEEQRAIVRNLRARTEFSAHVMVKLERQLALLAERRQALITAAVTGQLDVTTARGGVSR